MRASAIIRLTMLYRTLLVLTAGVLLLATPGCAKYPSGGTGSGPELVVTMTVEGQINPNDYYFVIFDVSNDQHGSNGPVPVIAPPWGNGICAAQNPPSSTNPGATSFVEYLGSSSAGNGNGYLLNVFTNSNLTQYQAAGVPVQSTAVTGAAANTLQFTVLLSQLATSSISANDITHIQINAIATDVIITNPTSTGPKDFDALNDPTHSVLSDYITIPTAQAGNFSCPCPGVTQSVTGSGGTTPNPANTALQITNLTVQVEG